ncbi:uncharacterized protein LOC135940171 isoform X2 [Cloeon dipterum]|uniref:uncharacterized protein LOC135940171 isoform X2 n=1 Tax=Cloeon dipterum TaxID=197152 RepID=UPI003220756C
MTSEPPPQQRHVHRRRRNRGPTRKHHAMEPPLPPEALTASRRKKPHNPLPAPSPDPPGMGEDDPTADDSSGLMGSGEVTGVGNATAVGTTRGSGAPLVRAEEAMIVCLVLLLWVGAIALFFNRWGKIRMLEPYQPKFQPSSHRPSCPLLEMPAVAPTASPPSCPLNQRLQCSKLNVSLDSAAAGGVCPHGHRPRQNSVFVAAPCLAAHLAPPPRKAKSAVDLQELFLEHEASELLRPRPLLFRAGGGRRASTLLPPLLPTVPDLPLTVEPPTPTPDSAPQPPPHHHPQQCHVVVETPPKPPPPPAPAILRVTHV